ncbi:hypothetical protein AAC03nite_26680 [Alicyclobacillus acidoterrestris]|uniref:SHOCT-like domain-containing protein n=1 Tax=Alicyclobacillus suci TaxID=2816080 RepID=UPI001196D0FD|nr:DUF4097 family beta strand repeat-containing protein [Alicyclobacillus suci]GEO26883.1 hypothetical protein AAC03nite_26680 [Alicyclobacillus acidoterrestris]
MMQERLKILELVAEGKLTVEQADLLLDALQEKSKDKSESKASWDKATNDLKSIGSQLSSVIAQSMTELRRGLETNLANLSFGDHIATAVEREFATDIQALRVNASNGRVRVERWSAPYIRLYIQADVRADEQDKAKELLEQAMVISETEHQVDLRLLHRVDGARVGGIRIDVYVPETLDNITVETRNGDIFINRACATTINVESTNGQIHIHHGEADILRSTTQNGSIVLHDSLSVRTKEVYAESRNGSIQVRGIPGDTPVRGKAITAAGTIQISHPDLDVSDSSEHRRNSCSFRTKEMTDDVTPSVSVYLETKNGRINVQ